MKIKRLFSVLGLGLFAMAAAGAGVLAGKGGKAESVKASPTMDYGNSGTVLLRLDTDEWRFTGSKIALYMFNNTEEKNAWGDFVVPSSESKFVEYSYSLDFTPEGCIAFRFDPGVETCGQWCFDDDRSNSAIWSTTNDIDFNVVIWLGAYYTSSKWTESGSFGLSAAVMGGATDDWSVSTVDTALTNVKINGNDEIEVYGEVALPANTYFKVVKAGSFWYNTYSADSSIASNFAPIVGEENIHNTAAGTYEFYFEYETGKIYIQDPVIAEADEWAQSFLTGGCTVTKSSWGDLADSFDDLSSGAQAKLAEEAHIDRKSEAVGYRAQAVQRYDYVLQLYGIDSKNTVEDGFEDFMGRAAVEGVDPGSLAKGAPDIYFANESSSPIIIISIVSLISASALLFVVVVMRRKHN